MCGAGSLGTALKVPAQDLKDHDRAELHPAEPFRRGWKWDAHLPLPEPDSPFAEQHMAQSRAAVQSTPAARSGAEPGADDAIQSVDADDDSWVPFNQSQLTPLLPQEIVWLLEEAQDRLRNRSNLPMQLELARTLARYTSVVYCQDENIRAWNCSRFAPLSA